MFFDTGKFLDPHWSQNSPNDLFVCYSIELSLRIHKDNDA